MWTMEPMVRNVGCSLKGNSSVAFSRKMARHGFYCKKGCYFVENAEAKEKTKEVEQRNLYLNMAVTSSNLRAQNSKC